MVLISKEVCNGLSSASKSHDVVFLGKKKRRTKLEYFSLIIYVPLLLSAYVGLLCRASNSAANDNDTVFLEAISVFLLLKSGR